MGSTRLPGKSMMPLAGEPLVYRILERLKKVRNIDILILAIPDTPENDTLEELARRMEVTCFRGSENDLLDRYYQAAKNFNLEIVMRIPADNVAPEATEIEKIVDFYRENNFNFCSNLSQVFHSGYPDGIGAEIFSFKDLEDFWKFQKDPAKREHIHLNFFNYELQQENRRMSVGTLECPLEYRRPDIILDVNTPEQYELMKKMYDDLYKEDRLFTIKDIIKWWDKKND